MWKNIKPNNYTVHFFEEDGKAYAAFVRENWIYKIAPNGEDKQAPNFQTDNWIYLDTSTFPFKPGHMLDAEIQAWLEMVWRTGAWGAYV